MRTLLIIGFGDIAQRALPQLLKHWRVIVFSRNQEKLALARTMGALPLKGDMDNGLNLHRLRNLADDILITTPPPDSGKTDSRISSLLNVLAKGPRIPQRLCYISTTGVYGNSNGEWVNESTPTAPHSDRAHRRMHAESLLRQFAIRNQSQLTILRAPGIYAVDRLPVSRLLKHIPLITPAEDSFSNHIHADDLARLCIASLHRKTGGIRIYNASDDTPLLINEWYQLLARTLSLPIPPLLSREEVKQQVSPSLWSFLQESRQISNARLSREFKTRLQYPSVRVFLEQLAANSQWQQVALASAGKFR